VSELFPCITDVVDDLTVIRSMVSEFPLHARANVFFHTGRNFGGFPSLGSWVTYGLGSENHNLPGYLLLNSGDNPPGGLENFSNGFLPATHQAMSVHADGVRWTISRLRQRSHQRIKMRTLWHGQGFAAKLRASRRLMPPSPTSELAVACRRSRRTC
jgi:hypothetical protein